MTRKDFELIAAVLLAARAEFPTPGKNRVHDYTVGLFVDALAHTNPRFDRARFIAAATTGAKP